MAKKIPPEIAMIGEHFDQFQENGDGWKAICPAHADTNPSLAIRPGDGGRVLIKCFAGCDTADVLDAVGLTFADLGPGDGQEQIIAHYDYRDEQGELLKQLVRYPNKSDGKKDIRQRRPDGKGGWIKNVEGVPDVLYRLPELLAANPLATVFIPEGEKDTDALTALGLVATTNSCGAGKWRAEYAEFLRGRRVVILPDNDTAGRKHAESIARSLQGIAASVKIVTLPGLPPKGDVSDWLEAGGTADKLLQLAEESAADGFVTRKLSEIERRPIDWLWPYRIALGKLTIIQGDPEVGKTYLVLDIIARVTKNRKFPDGTRPIHGNALIVACEDGIEDTIAPRLDILGVDDDRVDLLDSVRTNGRDDYLALDRHCAMLDQWLAAHPLVRLVFIDPLPDFLGNVNANSNVEMRRVLRPLVAVAQKHNVAIIALNHLTKPQGQGQTKALYRSIGSIAIAARARTIWQVALDRDDPERRLFLPVKMSIGKKPPGLAFRINDDDGLIWEEGEVHITADENDNHERERPRESAKAWLRDLLAKGPIGAKAIEQKAIAEKRCWKTIKTAKKELGIKSNKGKEGWSWRLP